MLGTSPKQTVHACCLFHAAMSQKQMPGDTTTHHPAMPMRICLPACLFLFRFVLLFVLFVCLFFVPPSVCVARERSVAARVCAVRNAHLAFLSFLVSTMSPRTKCSHAMPCKRRDGGGHCVAVVVAGVRDHPPTRELAQNRQKVRMVMDEQ